MNILLVDDEEDVKSLFEQRFRVEIRSGMIHLTFAHSGESALSYLAHPDGPTELVLSDINMPGMSGLELLQQIRSRPINPPPVVMMITAYSDQQSYDQAMAYGANDFLTKPIDFIRLKAKLRELNQGGEA